MLGGYGVFVVEKKVATITITTEDNSGTWTLNKPIVCLCCGLLEDQTCASRFCFAPQHFVALLNTSSATMSILGIVAAPIERFAASSSTITLVFASITSFLVFAVVVNVLNQILFRNPHEPPMVFHLFPIIGSTIQYGIDPYKFFFACREKV